MPRRIELAAPASSGWWRRNDARTETDADDHGYPDEAAATPPSHRASARADPPATGTFDPSGRIGCIAERCWCGPAKKYARCEPVNVACELQSEGRDQLIQFHHVMERSGMARAKRNKPHHPAQVHDRRSRDLLRNAEVAAVEVDDPFGLDPGDKIVTLRSIRNDPLGRLHTHRQIDEAQYQGGRAFQSDWEKAERGPQAVDPTREYVDGGQRREPITEGQRKAGPRLQPAHRALGAPRSALGDGGVILLLGPGQLGQRPRGG